MDILTYRWDHLQDILDIHQKPMLPASHPYVKPYIKWAYSINTAKGFYRKSDTADDLLLYDGATERVVFRHVDFHPCKKYHDLLFLFLRGPKLYYVLDSRGILFEFTDYVSNIYEQPSLTAQIDLDKGYYLVCGKLKMSFRDKTQQSDYIERTKADYGALFNKEYNCFIRQNVHNTNRYLYLTGGNSKCGRFLELFIKNGMAYERLPNILVDDETVNIRIPLFGTNAARKDVQFLFAKYNNTYAIQSIPITELCGGMNLPWETGDKYSAQFYMPPGKQVLVFAVINTLRNIFSDADDYTIFKKTMGKMFRQFEKGSSTEVNNEFLELLLMHPKDNGICAEYIEKHLLYIGALLKINTETDFRNHTDQFYGYDMRIYEEAYQASKRVYKSVMQNYEAQAVQGIIASGKKISKWTNEGSLYSMVLKQYPDAIFQFHSDWLGLQSLDIFIPSLSIGIEYQGLQHYEPVPFFGGEEGLNNTQERDRKKRSLCEQNGVHIIYWRYDETITASRLKAKLSQIKVDNNNH